MDMFDGNEYDTAVIGDQIFTDILGGKRMNLYTILVEPISKREFFGTKIMRILEKIVKRKGGSDEHNSAYKTGRSNRSSGWSILFLPNYIIPFIENMGWIICILHLILLREKLLMQ